MLKSKLREMSDDLRLLEQEHLNGIFIIEDLSVLPEMIHCKVKCELRNSEGVLVNTGIGEVKEEPIILEKAKQRAFIDAWSTICALRIKTEEDFWEENNE